MSVRNLNTIGPTGFAYVVRRYTLVVAAFLAMISANDMRAQGTGRPPVDTVRYRTVSVKPSATNAAIHAWDTTHVVYYDPAIASNKILLWLAGTNGSPLNVPADLFNTALAQGYRIIALSYMTVPAVSQVCVGKTLDANVNCPEMFRRQRIYGDIAFPLIKDESQDAIIPRLLSLLHWLNKNDAAGHWSHYLEPDGAKPNWKNIAVSGQSQGGGMSEYIGQHEVVARVVSFSGGWDYANSQTKKIATWYSKKAATPMERWYATYNLHEVAAKELGEICTTLRIPTGQIFALDKPLLNPTSTAANPYHGDGIRNPAYRPIWIEMFGSGIN